MLVAVVLFVGVTVGMHNRAAMIGRISLAMSVGVFMNVIVNMIVMVRAMGVMVIVVVNMLMVMRVVVVSMVMMVRMPVLVGVFVGHDRANRPPQPDGAGNESNKQQHAGGKGQVLDPGNHGAQRRALIKELSERPLVADRPGVSTGYADHPELFGQVALVVHGGRGSSVQYILSGQHVV